MKIKLGVIFGGETVEHEVSIISALQAIQNLNKNKYEIIPIYISKDRIWYTGHMLEEVDFFTDFENNKKFAKKVCLYKKGNKFYLQNTNGLFRRDITDLDIILPVVHGNNVEDGTLAGYFDTLGIPYVGSHVLGASLGQDKVVMKQVMSSCGLPIVDYTWFYDVEYLSDSKKILADIKKIGYPVIVKPANLGSSVGITVAKKEKDIESAIEEAIKYDNKIVVEKMVANLVEVNQAVLGNYETQELSAIAEMLTSNDFLTYEDKYIGNGKKTGGKKVPVKGNGNMSNSAMNIPAKLDKTIEKKVNQLSLDTFRALNLRGVARVDYLIDKKSKKVYINEPNTIPGSLSFYMFKAIGKSYTELLDDIITMTIKDYKDEHKKTTSFESNILSTYNGSKGAKGKMKI